MTDDLQQLLHDALLNNSFDNDAMHNTLKNTWMNSYSYLYSMQKSAIEYEEWTYYSNDDISRNSELMGRLYLDNLIYANFDIDYDLIHVLTREEFRMSEYYQNRFTIMDMVYNPDIFLKIPIVIIDDKVIWDYKIRVTKDCTTFTLPYRRNFVIKDERDPVTDKIIFIDHKIQVLVVDNKFYQRFTVNKNNIYFDPVNKTFKLLKSDIETLCKTQVIQEVQEKYKKKYNVAYTTNLSADLQLEMQEIINKRLRALELPKTQGFMMCSLHYPNSAMKGYEMGSSIIVLEDEGNSYVAHLTDNIVADISNHNRNMYLSLFFVNRLYRHKYYDDTFTNIATDKGAKLLVVQEDEMVPYKMPIPVEDFMVFKKSSSGNGGYVVKSNTDMLELHYPNIYRVCDEEMQAGDEYDIYYFYYNNRDLQYTVLFDFYFRFLTDYLYKGRKLEEIINDIYYDKVDLSNYNDIEKINYKNMFKKVYEYKYYNHLYGETDFLNRYLNIEGNEDKTPIEYKDETLREWIKVQPWVLRDYVLEQKKLGASYHLFTNTIDLPSRLRTNTKLEFGLDGIEFDEPRYVFAFNNEREYPVLLDCRVFVDGIMIGDVYQDRKLYMDYFYVPADLVTADSYIELEVFPGYKFKQELEFTSMDDVKTITLLDPSDTIFPTLADVFLDVNEEIPTRYDSKWFDITEHYDRGDILVKSIDPDKPVKFTRLSYFDIKPNDECVLNKKLNFKICKHPYNVRFMMDRDGYAYVSVVETGFSFNSDYIRIFRNGRLMPRSKYRLIATFEYPRILFTDWMNRGDIIYIDITPYRYKEIYYQEELSPDNTLIDLRSILNKPFDIRYYDVYLNGRKLSLNNVFSITPWEITLVNLHSRYNLVIYERERDWEYFGLDYNENIYYLSLDDLFESGLVDRNQRNELIKEIIDKQKDYRLNIYPNSNIEDKLDFSETDMYYPIFYLFYYDELMPKTYVNPDVLQFSDEIINDNFKEIYQNYMRSSWLESITEDEKLRRRMYPTTLLLDPDVYISPYGEEVDDATHMRLTDVTYDQDYSEDGMYVVNVERVPSGIEYSDKDDPLIYDMTRDAKFESDIPTSTPLLVFEVGHMEDVPQEFLDQTLEFKNDGNLDKNI